MLVQIYPFSIDDNAFTIYLKGSPYPVKSFTVIDGSTVELRFETEPTESQATELKEYLALFDNYAQVLMDESLMEKCKSWGRDMVDKFEVNNINRKRNGEMGRIELFNIMKEVHDSYVFICMLEGSLDTLHGILNGFPDEGSGAIAPFSFQYVWSEDIEWIKSELNIFLSEI